MKRTIVGTLLLGVISYNAYAQSGTNSPYSQFGLGELASQANGPGRGMNGLGIAYKEHNQVNVLNPASYSAIDSLSFIFDIGLSAQLTNFEENGKRLNARTAGFEYAVAGLRLTKNVGMSFGVLPYTNVGYNYGTVEKIGTGTANYFTSTFTGKGGLHQVYAGMGVEPIKGISLGVNIGYLWGSYNRSVANSYSDTYANTLSKNYSANIHSYKLDLGVQLMGKLSKKDAITFAATYGHGHKIGGNPTCAVVSYNSQTYVSDTASYPRVGKLDLEIPTSLGAGLMWNHSGKLKVGVDYSYEKWSDVPAPEYTMVDNVGDYRLSYNAFNDRHKATMGVELCPGGEYSRSFIKSIRYRAGVSYATPYIKINGQDGPKEFSASIGLGIPIINAWSNRSILNISAQYVRQDSNKFISENTFRITVGLTFNERWFDKWRVQ